MKLRIISDGTGLGTRVETEDGQVIENVIFLSFSVVPRGLVKVDLRINAIQADVVVERDQVAVIEQTSGRAA